MAKNGDALAIVGRRKDPLVQAKDRLTRLGASSVATLAGDLLDPAFREVIKNFRPVCDSVLVGGPSPPLGGAELLHSPHWREISRMGCEAALAYPYDITRWAFERGLQNNGKIILVSSSATLNPVPDKHFFLSQIYYTALEELVRLLPLPYSGHGARISVWHPGVVLTERTLAYAKTIDSGSDSLSRLEASKILATEFGETTVPTAAQYVSVRLRSKKK